MSNKYKVYKKKIAENTDNRDNIEVIFSAPIKPAIGKRTTTTRIFGLRSIFDVTKFGNENVNKYVKVKRKADRLIEHFAR